MLGSCLKILSSSVLSYLVVLNFAALVVHFTKKWQSVHFDFQMVTINCIRLSVYLQIIVLFVEIDFPFYCPMDCFRPFASFLSKGLAMSLDARPNEFLLGCKFHANWRPKNDPSMLLSLSLSLLFFCAFPFLLWFFIFFISFHFLSSYSKKTLISPTARRRSFIFSFKFSNFVFCIFLYFSLLLVWSGLELLRGQPKERLPPASFPEHGPANCACVLQYLSFLPFQYR